ncbi:MAG: TetR/AcrR family transcriptional regulator [Thermoleophilia bacterium]|nr:TetR/AcrR family transcriptional regulator [Thermoleophilia bacterium]
MHKRAERIRKRPERHLEHRCERRRLKPEVRRAELVDAALSVLRSRDPAEVRVEDVTQAAGAAKGTFYLYFSSWSDLLAAVRDRVFSDITSQVFDGFAVVGTADQWWVALEEQSARFIDFHVELGNLHQAIFHGPVTEHPMEAEFSADRVISRLLRQGMALGACRQVDADIAAPLVFSLLHATADGIVRSGGREERLKALLVLLRAWLSVPTAETGN